MPTDINKQISPKTQPYQNGKRNIRTNNV